MIPQLLLRTAVSAFRSVFRPTTKTASSKEDVFFAGIDASRTADVPSRDPLASSGRETIHVSAVMSAPEENLVAVVEEIVIAPVVQTPAPEVRAAPAAVEIHDYDTSHNRTFAKSHPRYAEAREVACRFAAERNGTATAREIAEHVRGPGGVPEFMVPVKSLSNRLIAFGLVRSVKDGASVWSCPTV